MAGIVGDAPRIDVQKLWEKYEDIAMHFNDLLMRLRTQGLAGIAAIATIVSLFTRTDAVDARTDWLVAGCSFTALAIFWVAIGCVDLMYYNRLLVGAVKALIELEKNSPLPSSVKINMSTQIGTEFESGWVGEGSSFWGVYLFYAIVFVVVVAGAAFSFFMFCISAPDSQMLKLWRVPV